MSIPFTLSFVIFKEKFAGDKVKDHTKGGCDHLGNDLMPVQLVVKHGIKPDIEAKERNAVENRKFDEETAARLAISGVEDPSRAGPEVENRGNREGNSVSPEWRKIRDKIKSKRNNPVDESIRDAYNDKLGQLLKHFGVLIKMQKVTTPAH